MCCLSSRPYLLSTASSRERERGVLVLEVDGYVVCGVKRYVV